MSYFRKRSVLTNQNLCLESLKKKLIDCDKKLKVISEPRIKSKNENYFRDSERRIDYILVYNLKAKEKCKDAVNKYIRNLENAGLEFESENSEQFPNLLFIKVHAPRNILMRYAYVMNVDLAFETKTDIPQSHRSFNFNFLFSELTRPDETTHFYQRAPDSISGQRPKDITSAERIMIVNQILSKGNYGEQTHEFGLKTLLQCKYLHDAYPLHDGKHEWTISGPLNDRQLLSQYWANFAMCFKLQPLELIQKYYGTEVAFYFSFLGFYNRMLISAMILGLATCIYGIHTYDSKRNIISDEICNSDIILCPFCHYESICTYIPIKASCTNSKVSYILDNMYSFIYSLLVCVWATFCLEIWKREQAILIYKWHLMSLENDPTTRPQFPLNTKYRRISKYSGKVEPYVPTTIRFGKIVISAAIIILASIIVLGIVISVIVYRLMVRYILGRHNTNQLIRSSSVMVATLTANTISLVLLILFEYLYTILARKLTDFENPRTQSEYDKSYIYKQYILCFVNGYALLYYTSFFKGRFFSYPGDKEQYDNLGVLNSDVCPPQGCILEISSQLAIILLGKSIFKSAMEVFIPKIKIYFATKKYNVAIMPIWERTYLEIPLDYYFLYKDYKDIILQYGYIILFTAVFPLAPLLAITYNTLEIRIDAYKLTRIYRRPVPMRVEGIGAWNVILKTLTTIGIATNAFLVAFTTQFVPFILRVYGDETSFISYTFSQFAVDDYDGVSKGNMSGKICYYRGKRYPPTHSRKYELTASYWHEFAIRFLTVMVIEVFVMCFTGLIAFMIPDVPRSIRERIANLQRMDMEMRDKTIAKNIINKERNSRAISVSSNLLAED